MWRTSSLLSLFVLALVACGGEYQPSAAEKAEVEAKAAEAKAAAAKAAAPAPSKPAEEAAAAEPAAPEPTTPEAIDQARKQAMIDGKDKDVVKYCELQGQVAGKGDPQALLGCALASCRLGEVDKAKAWSRGLPKPLLDTAIKVCAANKVML